MSLWIIVRVFAIVGVAAAVQTAMPRRTSAAARHLVWTLAVVSLLLLPAVSLVLPPWAVVPTARSTPADIVAPVNNLERAAVPTRSPGSLAERDASTVVAPVTEDNRLREFAGAAAAFSWTTITAITYATGVLVMLIHLLRQRRSVRQLANESIEAHDPEWTRLLHECAASMRVQRPVRLRRSHACSMPLTFGISQPTILIPAMADTWQEDRRRAVLLHELAHVARRDCFTQTLALLACTLYWFHPAAWWAARRLRIERELACDDRVLVAGASGRDYAGHLLEIAYSLGGKRAPALAVAMARPRQLEGRMLAVLDVARNRSVPRLNGRIAATAIAAALLLPIASATSTVIEAVPAADHSSQTASVSASFEDGGLPASWPRLQASLIDFATRIVRSAGTALGVEQDKLPGTWEIRPTNTEGIVHLRLRELNSSSGSGIRIEQLEGLTNAMLRGPGGPIQFRLRRDAGTFIFEGVLRNGVGAGTFSFTADVTFPAELAKRGIARPTALEQYQLARHDIGWAFVDELDKQGYAKPQPSELVRAAQHGVDTVYLRDMGVLGYRLGALEPLIKLRDHGVTPDYIRDLSDLGHSGLLADDLQRARDHGVTPEYVRGMRDSGYGSHTIEQLITARDHGVEPKFVGELAQLGYRKLPLDQLIRARDHGVDGDFVRGMVSLGYSDLSVDSLVRLRDHGVTPDYAKEIRALGYDRLSADDLVTLRDHGLTADRIRAANARAKTRLPVDLLKRLAASGQQ